MDMKQLVLALSSDEKKELLELLSNENNNVGGATQKLEPFEPLVLAMDRTNNIINYLLINGENELGKRIRDNASKLRITPTDKYILRFIYLYKHDVDRLVREKPDSNILTHIGYVREHSSRFEYHYCLYIFPSNLYYSLDERISDKDEI